MRQRETADAGPPDAEVRLRALMDALPDAYCEIEVLFEAGRPFDYRFLRANCHFERQTGLSQAIGRTIRELAPGHEQHWFDLYGEVARTGRPAHFVEHAAALGRWYEVRAHRIGGEGSRHVGVVFADVTERELGRARERDSEMRASLAVAIAQLGTFRLDPATGRVSFDARMAEQWGRPAEPGSFLIDELITHIHPDDREHTLAVAASVLDPRQPGRYELDYRGIWPDGSEHWIYANGQAQLEGEGETRRVVSVIGTTRDVTRRKQAEARLRASEQRLGAELAAAKSLQQLSTRLIVGERPDELYSHVLEAACDLVGADAASLQSLDVASGELVLIAHRGFPPEAAQAWRRLSIDDGSCCARALARGERVLVRDIQDPASGLDEPTLHPYRLTGTRGVQSTPLVSRSGQPLGMVSTHWFRPVDPDSLDLSLFDVLARQVSDLIDRTRTEQALRASEERLREADVRKDEFLATLAHELRNPLATIRTAVELVSRGGAAVDPGAVHAMLRRQVEHMVRLIDDLMEVSRISRGVIELTRQPLDLAEVVREAVDVAGPAIERAGLVLGLQLSGEVLPLEGDRVRLAQVLSNLLSNAVRYTDPGGRIDVAAWRDEGRAHVAVTDTGIGIAADKLPGLFAMFRQIDRRDARSQGGLGIGLSLAQRLAQMHGGRIRAESAGLGHGSRFTLELPLSAQALATTPTGAPSTGRSAASRRVLVVDDNHDAADSTAMLLSAVGAQVQVAYDGPAALRTLENWRPDLVLLDIGMPEMDGLEVAARIRGNPALDGVRLVALTGWGQDEDIARTRAGGFDTHLVKPAGAVELVDVLERVVPTRR